MPTTSVIWGTSSGSQWPTYVSFDAPYTGSTNWRGWWDSNGSTIWAVSMTGMAIPNVPSINRGTNNRAYAYLMGMGLDAGGYNSAGDFRFRVWTSSGTSIWSSNRVRTPNNGTTINLPRISYDTTTGTWDDDLSSPASWGNSPTTLPILTTGTTSGGTTSFRFGIYGTTGYVNALQLQVKASGDSGTYDIQQDSTSTPTSNFSSTGTHTSNAVLIGKAYYAWMPSAPSTPVYAFPGVRSLYVVWNEALDNGGVEDSDFYYAIQCKKTSDEWIKDGYYDLVSGISNTANTIFYDINGDALLDGTAYNVRVFSVNSASWYASDVSTSPITGDTSPVVEMEGSESTIALPNWSTGDTDLTTEAVINTEYSTNADYEVSATGAISYSISSGALPTGLSLSTVDGAAVLSGVPTAVGSFTFTINAENDAGSSAQSFTIVIIGGAQVWNPATSSWKLGTVKVYKNSVWNDAVVKVYSSGAWKVLG